MTNLTYLEDTFEKRDESMIWQNTFASQPAITCSKLTMETLEQGVKYVQS